jgi:glycosyltransferase involved in cell wall biosynthesis
MKVLYISYDGMTDPLGQSQVIPYLKGLSQKGHEIILISCEKKDRFNKQNNEVRSILDSSAIEWHPVSYSSLPSILSKQFNLSAIHKKAQEICKEQKPKIVHCRSYMAALVGLKLKRKFGLKFIFDMRGFWADERIDGNIWSIRNPIHKQLYAFFKKKEKEFLLNADHTIALTQNAKNEILSWEPFSHKSIPIEVIPCCADLGFFSPEKLNSSKTASLRNELGLNKNELIISYLGSIGTWYMLDEMLDFFKCLLEKDPNARFLFITQDNKAEIFRKAEQKNIPEENLRVVSAFRTDVPSYVSLSRLSLYFIKPFYSKKASSPTKTGEILAMGIPVITNSGIGDSDSMILDSKAGLLVNDFTTEEYRSIIGQIDVLLKTDKTVFIKASQKYFSLETGIDLYNSVYKQLQ